MSPSPFFCLFGSPFSRARWDVTIRASADACSPIMLLAKVVRRRRRELQCPSEWPAAAGVRRYVTDCATSTTRALHPEATAADEAAAPSMSVASLMSALRSATSPGGATGPFPRSAVGHWLGSLRSWKAPPPPQRHAAPPVRQGDPDSTNEAPRRVHVGDGNEGILIVATSPERLRPTAALPRQEFLQLLADGLESLSADHLAEVDGAGASRALVEALFALIDAQDHVRAAAWLQAHDQRYKRDEAATQDGALGVAFLCDCLSLFAGGSSSTFAVDTMSATSGTDDDVLARCVFHVVRLHAGWTVRWEALSTVLGRLMEQLSDGGADDRLCAAVSLALLQGLGTAAVAIELRLSHETHTAVTSAVAARLSDMVPTTTVSWAIARLDAVVSRGRSLPAVLLDCGSRRLGAGRRTESTVAVLIGLGHCVFQLSDEAPRQWTPSQLDVVATWQLQWDIAKLSRVALLWAIELAASLAVAAAGDAASPGYLVQLPVDVRFPSPTFIASALLCVPLLHRLERHLGGAEASPTGRTAGAPDGGGVSVAASRLLSRLLPAHVVATLLGDPPQPLRSQTAAIPFRPNHAGSMASGYPAQQQVTALFVAQLVSPMLRALGNVAAPEHTVAPTSSTLTLLSPIKGAADSNVDICHDSYTGEEPLTSRLFDSGNADPLYSFDELVSSLKLAVVAVPDHPAAARICRRVCHHLHSLSHSNAAGMADPATLLRILHCAFGPSTPLPMASMLQPRVIEVLAAIDVNVARACFSHGVSWRTSTFLLGAAARACQAQLTSGSGSDAQRLSVASALLTLLFAGAGCSDTAAAEGQGSSRGVDHRRRRDAVTVAIRLLSDTLTSPSTLIPVAPLVADHDPPSPPMREMSMSQNDDRHPTHKVAASLRKLNVMLPTLSQALEAFGHDGDDDANEGEPMRGHPTTPPSDAMQRSTGARDRSNRDTAPEVGGAEWQRLLRRSLSPDDGEATRGWSRAMSRFLLANATTADGSIRAPLRLL